ncbi:MAG: hypothetical protein ABI870_15455 [Rhodanobacter sp.]
MSLTTNRCVSFGTKIAPGAAIAPTQVSRPVPCIKDAHQAPHAAETRNQDGGRQSSDPHFTSWLLRGLRMEVSGLHHNVFGGFLGLRIGIYSASEGDIVIRDFRYRALSSSGYTSGISSLG